MEGSWKNDSVGIDRDVGIVGKMRAEEKCQFSRTEPYGFPGLTEHKARSAPPEQSVAMVTAKISKCDVLKTQ